MALLFYTYGHGIARFLRACGVRVRMLPGSLPRRRVAATCRITTFTWRNTLAREHLPHPHARMAHDERHAMRGAWIVLATASPNGTLRSPRAHVAMAAAGRWAGDVARSGGDTRAERMRRSTPRVPIMGAAPPYPHRAPPHRSMVAVCVSRRVCGRVCICVRACALKAARWLQPRGVEPWTPA